MKLNKLLVSVVAVLSNTMFYANAVPVNNINNPVQNGISHNVYSEFNVGKEGVIFNNSLESVNTQLAGKINGNSNLDKAASIIIAEVQSKSSKASQLNGMMEVAGNPAELIIANPAGINCNGCGSINTSRFSLVAGNVVINRSDSGTTYFNIDKGEITIDKDGMHSGQTDFTDIIARAVKVNGQILAKNLSLLTGKIEVSRHRGEKDFVFKNSSSYFGKPGYALDVTALGGMYADRIILEGNEAGVGVRNSGIINANDLLSLNAKGNFTNNQSAKMNSGDLLSVSVRDTIINQGEMSATNQNLEAKSVKNMKNGIISADKNVLVTSKTFSNKGVVFAGENAIHFSPSGIKFIK